MESKNRVVDCLEKEKQDLMKIKGDAEREIESAPEGSVYIEKYKNSFQFYLNKHGCSKGIYIPAGERDKAYDLIRKRYLIRLVKAAEKQIKVISDFLDKYDPDSLKTVFEREGKTRQRFLKPVVLPDDLYASAWQEAEYKPKEFYDQTPVHYTMKHEKVRSKSEVMIANCLSAAGVPYRYECPLKLGVRIIHPDFTILRMHDRKEIYWEHLGMIDDTEYRNNALKRIREYESNGYFPGEDLIVTAETYKVPLNTVVIEQQIKHFILPGSS